MKRYVAFVLPFFFVLPVFALKSDGKVQADWQRETGKLSVTVQVAEGFHVNEKAPAQLRVLPSEKIFPPLKIAAKKVIFAYSGKISAKEKYVASIYVCDDALTVCEPREWTWSESGMAEEASPAAVKESPADVQMKKAQSACAKQKRGHILLEFSARWCPGCMRLEQEVWNQPEIKKTMKEFAVVKMDSDVYSSKSFMKKYEVSGIPATLVLNCQGQEIDRVVDFLNARAMKKSLIDFAKPGVPVKEDLIKQAQGGNLEAALHLGRRAAWSYQNEEAAKWFVKVPATEREKYFEYWNATLANQRDAATTDRALAALPETASSLAWLAELADVQGATTPGGQKTLQRLVAKIDLLIADPEKMKKFIASEPPGESEGFETLHIYDTRANALEALDRKEEAIFAWQQAVKEGDRLNIKESVSGPFYRFVVVLKKAGEKERVRKFFDKNTRGAHPKGDIARRYANFLYEQGDYKKALSMAEKAMKDSYDQNEVFSAVIYAKALAKNGKSIEARQILLRYEALPQLESSTRDELRKQLNLLQ